MVSDWIPIGIHMDFHWIPIVFQFNPLWDSHKVPTGSILGGFPMDAYMLLIGFPFGAHGTPGRVHIGFPLASQWDS